VVRQRTALLKSARGRQPMLGALEAWDDQLIRTGAELMSGRLELIGALRPLIVKSYAGVAGDDSAVEVSYRPAHLKRIQPDLGEPTADTGLLAASMREALAGYRAAEIDRGVCLVGPHRDELDLRIGELPARGYASHGESWSLALAMRLAGYELLRSAGGGGGDPVLLLDDVFAELDGQRRDRLATVAAAAEQVIVTAAVPADLPEGLRAARFNVSTGVISRA
jgi:DNA replication and repair protein RecF